MTATGGLGTDRLTVLRGSDSLWRAGTLKQAIGDGTALIGIGGAVAVGFGVEVVRTLATDQPGWLVAVLVGASTVGIVLLLAGVGQRSRAHRRRQVGIVATAADPRRDLANANRLEQQGEEFAKRSCALVFKARVQLSGDTDNDLQEINQLADSTLEAMTWADQLSPDAARINLVPAMPLHVGFWYGARLGHTFSREVAVHSTRQARGAPLYFPATMLRVTGLRTKPLTVGPSLPIEGGDMARAALALDLQHKAGFLDEVVTTCKRDGIGRLVLLRSRRPRLAENNRTFSGVVEQTCQALLDAHLPGAVRRGHRAVFLSGPLAIAVALGARLAPQRNSWTAYTYDRSKESYEAFPATTRH